MSVRFRASASLAYFTREIVTHEELLRQLLPLEIKDGKAT